MRPFGRRRREAEGEGVPDESRGASSSSGIVCPGTIDFGHRVRRRGARPVSATVSPPPARRPSSWLLRLRLCPQLTL